MSELDPFDREAMDRAIRRLNVLEYLILGAAALLALLGGALVAWIVSATLPVSFRLAWIVASLLLFAVPGAIVYAREQWHNPQSVEREPESRTGEVDG